MVREVVGGVAAWVAARVVVDAVAVMVEGRAVAVMEVAATVAEGTAGRWWRWSCESQGLDQWTRGRSDGDPENR